MSSLDLLKLFRIKVLSKLVAGFTGNLRSTRHFGETSSSDLLKINQDRELSQIPKLVYINILICFYVNRILY